MTEYRIIKKSMVETIGQSYFKFGETKFYYVYSVQYKRWWGKWRNIKGASTCLTLTQARNILGLIKQGLFTDGFEVVE